MSGFISHTSARDGFTLMRGVVCDLFAFSCLDLPHLIATFPKGTMKVTVWALELIGQPENPVTVGQVTHDLIHRHVPNQRTATVAKCFTGELPISHRPKVLRR